MRKLGHLFIAATLSATLLGGCPTPTSPFDSATPGGSTTDATTTASGGQVSGTQTTDPSEFSDCVEPLHGDEWRARILERVNEERAAAGVGLLTYNETLERQADQYACEMLHYDFFAHENPVTGSTLGDRAEEFGYDYTMIGENLAAGQLTPDQAMEDWMNSSGHRANILEEQFTEIGVGIRLGGRYGYYWVQEFGRPR